MIINILLSVVLSCAFSKSTVMTYDDYIDQAEKLLDINSAKNAIPPLKKAITLKPEGWKAYKMLGLVYHRTADYKEAVLNFTKASKLKPDSAELHYYTGVSYGMMKDYDNSIKSFRKAVELKANHLPSLVNLAASYYQSRHEGLALETYEKVLALEPDNFDANYYSAIIVSKTSDKKKAIALFENANKIKPEDKNTIVNLNKLYKETGMLAAPVGETKEAVPATTGGKN